MRLIHGVRGWEKLLIRGTMQITLVILKRGCKAQNEKCEMRSAKCEMEVAIVTANVDVMSVCICLPPSLYLRSSFMRLYYKTRKLHFTNYFGVTANPQFG